MSTVLPAAHCARVAFKKNQLMVRRVSATIAVTDKRPRHHSKSCYYALLEGEFISRKESSQSVHDLTQCYLEVAALPERERLQQQLKISLYA